MLITLHAPKLRKGITIRLSERTVKALQARMAIGISLHMFPLETRRVKAKRAWKAPEELEKYHLVYFNNQWYLKDKVSSNNTSLNLKHIPNAISGRWSASPPSINQIPTGHPASVIIEDDIE